MEANVAPEISSTQAPENPSEKCPKIHGQLMLELPLDLYIPPDALEVILESFEGPLDLLLYLIKKENMDILDIPVAKITHQYISYVELMRELNIELAAEYLVMAAMLAEIKSRMLLPRPAGNEGDDEGDPRAELIRRLQEYERFKKAAEDIDEINHVHRDVFTVEMVHNDIAPPRAQPDLDMQALLLALVEVFQRAQLNAHHTIEREVISLRERMSYVLQVVNHETFTPFVSLFIPAEGRSGVVVTFIAILELLRQSMIEMVQAEPFAPIHIKAAG